MSDTPPRDGPKGLPSWLLGALSRPQVPPFRACRAEEISLAAMRAGLRGARMPDFGTSLTADELRLVNCLYDEARNWSAGSKETTRAK